MVPWPIQYIHQNTKEIKRLTIFSIVFYLNGRMIFGSEILESHSCGYKGCRSEPDPDPNLKQILIRPPIKTGSESDRQEKPDQNPTPEHQGSDKTDSDLDPT